jgi:ATP-dependent DNA helicase UvrD/PcrA
MAIRDVDMAHAATPFDAAAELRRRLVVLEAPTMNDLQAGLHANFPDIPFEARGDWEFSADHSDCVPVWHWSDSDDEFARRAGTLLRRFVYPLVAGGSPFCVGLPFGRDHLAPRELDIESRHELDIEDIGVLLMDDALTTTLHLLDQLANRVVQTPIEERLLDALTSAGVPVKPQMRWGKHRLDFLVEHDGLRVAVEADGRQFHDEHRDHQRDLALQSLGIDRVFHFTGSQIHRAADACAAEVARFLNNGPQSPIPIQRNFVELDETQRAAVQHGKGAARVLAPAGSGKTTTLVQRVAKLVADGIEPASILVLAFNKKATEQLVERLTAASVPVNSKRIADPDDLGVVIANFNAFGNRYQRELLDLNFHLEESNRVWSQMMAGTLSEMGIDLNGTKKGSNPVGQFLQMLDRVRADLVPPSGVEVGIEYFDSRGTSVVQFGPVHRAFEERRLNAGIQSFGDQLPTAVIDLLGNPQRRRQIQSRFEHVLVDEFQDLSESQLALVDILSRPWRDLYVVGDDDQLIYAWRYAKSDNLLHFHERMPAEPYSATYTLGINYRCSRSIVETSRRVIEHNKNRVSKDIRARDGATEGSVRFFRDAEWRRRADEMCRFLKQQKEAPNRRWRELAVLCRYKAQQPLVALALDQAGIPRTALLAYRLFSHPSMRLLRSYLALVRAPGQLDGASLAYLINRPNRYVSNETVALIEQAAESWGLIKELSGHPKAPTSLVQLVARVGTLRESYARERPTSRKFLEDVLEEFELIRHWADRSSRDPLGEQDAGDPLHLVDAVRMLAADVPDIDTFLERWDERTDREGERWDMESDTLGREERPKADQVVIGTMHSSKGREYETVVLFDYHSNLADFTPEETEEERRLFYVGLTRARETVLLTVDGAREGLHRFFRDAIEAAGPEESERLLRERQQLREQDKRLTIQMAHVQDELDAIFSGQALTEAKAAVADASSELEVQASSVRELGEKIEEKTAERNEADQAAEALEQQLALSFLRRATTSLTGRRRRLQAQLAETVAIRDRISVETEVLSSECASAEVSLFEIRGKLQTAEDRVALLRAKPKLVATDPKERLDALRAEAHTMQVLQQKVDGRLHELGMVAPS